jgi:outer membrane protein assembly factor BamB
MAIDALTGELIWRVPATGGALYGATYVDGKLVWGALDNNMHCWDADTGELLWTYNPGTWYGMWASATGAAYGMVFEKNQDTYLYAIDLDTGEMVWRAKGPGIGYSNTLMISEDKVYAQMGEDQYRDFDTGEFAYSEYNCYDAFTGELIWTMPLENTVPYNTECLAYGNMYVIPTTTPQVGGSWTYTRHHGLVSEVWCISSEPTDWPMYCAGPEHKAWGAGPTNLAHLWKFEADATIQGSPAIVDGVCYFGTHLGTIYAIDADTATELWSFKTNHWVKSTVAVVDGRVYTGADEGSVYCLDAATGQEIWKTWTGGVMKNPIAGARTVVGADNTRSSPIVLDGRVYVGALDGKLYCLDADNGNIIWDFVSGGPIYATPTIVDNAIYIPASTPAPDGTVYKLDLNGNVIWQKPIPYLLGLTGSGGNYMQASATVAYGMVYIRIPFRHHYALNATTGEIIWFYDGRYNPGSPEGHQRGGVHQFMPVLYVYDRLYFSDFYGITCLNATDGTEIWHTYLSREDLAQAITYSFERIYVVVEYGVLFVLDAKTGEKLSYYEFAPTRSQLHCTPTPYNGKLYVGANDFHMHCFGEARLVGSADSQASVSASSSMPLEQASTGLQEAQFISTETAIIAAIAVACLIGVASYWTLRRRK